MAWVNDTYTNAPLVRLQSNTVLEALYKIDNATTYTRTRTTIQFERRGMTKTVADAGANALAATGKSTTVTPIGAGGYNIVYSSDTSTAWIDT